MNTLSWFSLCDDESQTNFNEALQSEFSKISSITDEKLSSQIDQIIEANRSLQGKCVNLSKIAVR